MRLAISTASVLVPFNIDFLLPLPLDTADAVATIAPAILAKNAKHCFVDSVLPAPDSPLMRILWSLPNAHIELYALLGI